MTLGSEKGGGQVKKRKKETAKDKIEKIIGVNALDLCLNSYKKMWELDSTNPFPSELGIINEKLYQLYKGGYLTKKEASHFDREITRVVLYGNRGRILNIMRSEATKRAKKQGAPDFPKTFFLLALVAEMKASDNHIKQSEIYDLIEDYLYEGCESIAVDVKSTYNRWKNRPEIIEYLNYFISSGNLTAEIIAIRDHILAL